MTCLIETNWEIGGDVETAYKQHKFWRWCRFSCEL